MPKSDAIVCGAGPAGVTLVTLLKDRSVSVIDAKPFWTDEGVWHPEAYRFLWLEHHLYPVQ
ncbi:MAG: hypothetical protein JRM79_03395 [Nitrososphaerota archaeon]|nr:hypothetical protein [Nitrososphaerota archaeon]MDG6912762.1 hypothetical protein [Nitrososphaerota archaeon]MDG6941283.1 hypothetical protein [Nitrososphaerota archaeon]MDG6958679.1 hypothetical protein [Nitrososphaerota archaeon]MDG6971258.1 hypothetical protein [Nitrososphaerota archaeon]